MQGLPLLPTGPSGIASKPTAPAPPPSTPPVPSSSQLSEAPPPSSAASTIFNGHSSHPDVPALSPAVLRDLQPLIMAILRRSDINTVTRKIVVRSLAQNTDGLAQVQRFHALRHPIDPLDPQNKHDLQEVVRVCFEQIQEEIEQQAAQNKPPPPPKGSSSSSSSSKPVKPKPKVEKIEKGDDGDESDLYDEGTVASTAGDAALAAKLQAEANGRPSRSSRSNGSSSTSKPKKSTVKRKRKTDDLVGSDEDPDATGRPVKAKRAPNPNNPFNRPMVLDEKMFAVCGEKELSRPQVVKALWAYIKGNQLQDPSNGRKIICDDKLETLFGKKIVDSFEMAKLIGSHLHKKEDLV